MDRYREKGLLYKSLHACASRSEQGRAAPPRSSTSSLPQKADTPKHSSMAGGRSPWRSSDHAGRTPWSGPPPAPAHHRAGCWVLLARAPPLHATPEQGRAGLPLSPRSCMPAGPTRTHLLVLEHVGHGVEGLRAELPRNALPGDGLSRYAPQAQDQRVKKGSRHSMEGSCVSTREWGWGRQEGRPHGRDGNHKCGVMHGRRVAL